MTHPHRRHTGDAVAWIEAGVTDGAGGADIGLGVLVFVLFALVALAGGARDGVAGARRGEPEPGWVLRWAAVAVLFGVLSAVRVSVLDALAGGDSSVVVLASDLLGVTPSIALLVGVPAVAGLAIGRAVWERQRPVAGPRS